MTYESTLNTETSWQQQNYKGLLAEIDRLKTSLRHRLPDQVRNAANEEEPTVLMRQLTAKDAQGVVDSQATISVTSSTQRESVDGRKQTSVMLNNLCALFSLSAFERQLVVLCIAMELDPDMPALCMELSQQPSPSMALALMCFDGHCSAMAEDAPLAYFQLIELKRDNHSFARRSLAIGDWALFFLTGAPVLDPLLATVMHPIKPLEPTLPTPLKNAELLGQARHYLDDSQAVVQLIATTHDDQRQVAALLANREGREIYEFSLYQVPLRADEQSTLMRRIAREVISRQCLILIDCQRLVASGESKADSYVLRNWLDCLLRGLPTAFLLCASEQIHLPQTKIHYQRLPALPNDEQLQLWQHCLQDNNTDAVQPTLLELTTQYNLTSAQVRSIARSATIDHSTTTAGDTSPENLQKTLWQHSREQSRQNLHGLAQVIPPQQLDWNDLILPENEKNRLQSIVSQARQRKRVYQQWGFAKQVPYGLGICALFAGGSGTGKTMAARLIASLLNLDLYHVDISSVVDKYIGETEKKLDTLFQAADNSGAVLLFDEADALFGKRAKVHDARDRYANTGVSFLLQRMERYAGLSILTTNMRSALDAAFTRRLRFIVQFPFPSEQEREKIWRCMIPATAPTEQIDFKKLARLVLAGGAIRNIVLQAAFMAAEAEQPITMQCLYEAVRQEYIKAEKTLDANLVKDW
jgi:hypothetical protein